MPVADGEWSAIRTPDQRLRVFVSSTLEELAAERGERFTDAGELQELIASDLAMMLAERFGGPDRAARWPAIPSPVSALVGRDADVAEVTRMLTAPGARLVVLTGVGGAGKTRLALAVAERIQEQWADGAAFADLSPVTDPRRPAPRRPPHRNHRRGPRPLRAQALAMHNPDRTPHHPADHGAAARWRVHRATGRRPQPDHRRRTHRSPTDPRHGGGSS